jgi:hypothetical protein
MLFNLSKQSHFPKKRTGEEIYCHSNWGPCFSGRDSWSELSARDEPFNGDNACYSAAKCSSYGIPVDGAGTNMLTNKKDDRFTISELEVWQVTYLEWDRDTVRKEDRQWEKQREKIRKRDR